MTLRKLRFLLIICSLATSSVSSNATTLSYVGKEFFSGNIFDGHVEATVTFSTPLTQGAVLFLPDISSFSLSVKSPMFGNRTIVGEEASFAFAEFAIGDDGLPSDWGLGVELDIEGSTSPEQITTHAGTTDTIFGSRRSFDSDSFLIDDPRANESFGLGASGGATALSAGPGVWTLVPEPGTRSVVGFCFLAILLRPRRLIDIFGPP